MDNKNNETKEKPIEYNTPIPNTNFNGTPNYNALNNYEQTDTNNNKIRVRRPLQQNSYMVNRLTRNGYIGLQILIIILTLSTLLGMIIGATIFVYTK